MTRQLFDSGFDWCPPDARAGDFYKLRVKDLSPTQFAVGKAEVAVRTAGLRKKYNKDSGKLQTTCAPGRCRSWCAARSSTWSTITTWYGSCTTPCTRIVACRGSGS